MGIPRSRLFAKALKEFVEHHALQSEFRDSARFQLEILCLWIYISGLYEWKGIEAVKLDEWIHEGGTSMLALEYR